MPQSTLLNTNFLTRQLQLPNGSLLRNRLAKASMSEALGTYDNRPTPGLVTLYQRWAASGIGLILTGNVMIDRRALGEPGNVVIEDEADLPILQKWAHAATDQGAAIWVQLNHPGKQSTKGLNERNIAPSAVPACIRSPRPTPKRISASPAASAWATPDMPEKIRLPVMLTWPSPPVKCPTSARAKP